MIVPEDRREAYYHHRVRASGPQYSGFDLLSTEVTLSFLYTYDLFQQHAMRCIAARGLSKSGFNVLMLLRHAAPEGMQLHDLGELLLVTRANITGLIDHLEQKGLVKRVVDSHDRRARYARITRRAELLLDDLIPIHYRNIHILLQDLSAEEKEVLLKLLQKTRASLIAHADSEACVDAPVLCPTAQE